MIVRGRGGGVDYLHFLEDGKGWLIKNQWAFENAGI